MVAANRAKGDAFREIDDAIKVLASAVLAFNEAPHGQGHAERLMDRVEAAGAAHLATLTPHSPDADCRRAFGRGLAATLRLLADELNTEG